MPRPEWGTKHRCEDCGARFYDLLRSTINCPQCGKTASAHLESTLQVRQKKVNRQVNSQLEDQKADDDDAVLDSEDEVESVPLDDIKNVSTEDLD